MSKKYKLDEETEKMLQEYPSRLIIIFVRMINGGITYPEIQELGNLSRSQAETVHYFIRDMSTIYLLPDHELPCYEEVFKATNNLYYRFKLLPINEYIRSELPNDIEEKIQNRKTMKELGMKTRTEYSQRYRLLYTFQLLLNDERMSKKDFMDLYHASDKSIETDFKVIRDALSTLSVEGYYNCTLEYNRRYDYYELIGEK